MDSRLAHRILRRSVDLALLAGAIASAGCGRAMRQVATATLGTETAALSAPGGQLVEGSNDVAVAVTAGPARTPLAADSVRFALAMPMPGGAPMREEVRLSRKTPGRYAGRIATPMAGDWWAEVTFDGPAGTETIRMKVTVQAAGERRRAAGG